MTSKSTPQPSAHTSLYTLAVIAMTVIAVVAMVCINARADAHRVTTGLENAGMENARVDTQTNG